MEGNIGSVGISIVSHLGSGKMDGYLSCVSWYFDAGDIAKARRLKWLMPPNGRLRRELEQRELDQRQHTSLECQSPWPNIARQLCGLRIGRSSIISRHGQLCSSLLSFSPDHKRTRDPVNEVPISNLYIFILDHYLGPRLLSKTQCHPYRQKYINIIQAM